MKATLLINCPDQSGIISSVTSLVHAEGGNITYLDQHVDMQAGIFFMRLETDFNGRANFNQEQFEGRIASELADPYRMSWNIHWTGSAPRMAIFVSKYNHCLYDLLSRYHAGELAVELPFILSNHPDLQNIAEQFSVPFFHVPVIKGQKEKAEAEQLRLLQEHRIDFIVLARYMQIVSPRLIDEFPHRIINIHHSFLPAFAGAKPYHAAFERGVKIIGATSHYVTEELDAGPIIAQDVIPVTHAHTVSDFIAKGRDLEKLVLSRAVQLHVSRKTMVYNNKTVIFS
ncbi:MAG: formyltetrahydrofolate deformylase [Flavobacteriaceae bacterium]|nr:formyltetrahydrofolate deformylase [Flavobacteriaceae bacterium]